MDDESPPVTVDVVDAPDLDVLDDAIDGVPIRIDRFAAAEGRIRLSSVDVGDVVVTTGRFDVPIRSTAGVAAGHLLVGVPLEASDGRWNGVGLDPSTAWWYAPGAEHVGVAMHPPWWAAITVAASLVDGHVSSRRSHDVVRSAAVGRLADLVRGLHEPAPEPLPADAIRDALVESVIDVVDGVPVESSATGAARIVARCEALADDLGPIPRVAALAEAIGVSDRAVRGAFVEHYGVAPAEYYRSRALAACRRELLAADPAADTITDVAMRNGFWHLGRFAVNYRRRFGESPHVTLSRR